MSKAKKATRGSAAVATRFNRLLKLYTSKLVVFGHLLVASLIFIFLSLIHLLTPPLTPPFLSNKMSLARGILLFGRQASTPSVQLFMLKSSLPTAMEARTHSYTHTCVHTHIELCKCMCHVLLAALFLGLCFVKGNWQLQYRVR